MDQVTKVYFFDPRQFQQTKFGTLKTGAFRALFLLQSVRVLKRRLRSIGSLESFSRHFILLKAKCIDYSIEPDLETPLVASGSNTMDTGTDHEQYCNRCKGFYYGICTDVLLIPKDQMGEEVCKLAYGHSNHQLGRQMMMYIGDMYCVAISRLIADYV